MLTDSEHLLLVGGNSKLKFEKVSNVTLSLAQTMQVTVDLI